MEGWYHTLVAGSKPVRLYVYDKRGNEWRVGTIYACSEWVPVMGSEQGEYIVWANQRHYVKDLQKF